MSRLSIAPFSTLLGTLFSAGLGLLPQTSWAYTAVEANIIQWDSVSKVMPISSGGQYNVGICTGSGNCPVADTYGGSYFKIEGTAKYALNDYAAPGFSWSSSGTYSLMIPTQVDVNGTWKKNSIAAACIELARVAMTRNLKFRIAVPETCTLCGGGMPAVYTTLQQKFRADTDTSNTFYPVNSFGSIAHVNETHGPGSGACSNLIAQGKYVCEVYDSNWGGPPVNWRGIYDGGFGKSVDSADLVPYSSTTCDGVSVRYLYGSSMTPIISTQGLLRPDSYTVGAPNATTRGLYDRIMASTWRCLSRFIRYLEQGGTSAADAEGRCSAFHP